MAKELPYFKFDVAEWINGSITLESYSAQGLFINICSHYWFKSGILSLTEIKRRLSSGLSEDFDSLISSGVIRVENDMIRIQFLDEQLQERMDLSRKNSVNGSKGGRPKATGLNWVSQKKANESNIEEKRREESNTLTHGKGKKTITIKRVFAGDPIHKIHDLREYFRYTGQLDAVEEVGLTHFEAFVEANSGKVFNEPDHLYNSFRIFCKEYSPPPRAPNKYEAAEYNKTLWTLEAWEEHYRWRLDSDDDFRQHFGYGKLQVSKSVGS